MAKGGRGKARTASGNHATAEASAGAAALAVARRQSLLGLLCTSNARVPPAHLRRQTGPADTHLQGPRPALAAARPLFLYVSRARVGAYGTVRNCTVFFPRHS